MKDDKQYKSLLSEIRGAREEIARIDRDLANDRKQIGDTQVELASVKAELEELRKGQIGIVNKVGDKIAENVAPVIKSADNLAASIDEATIVKVKEQKKKGLKDKLKDLLKF